MTDVGREQLCGCGNDLSGDNLCMVSACQWEGTVRELGLAADERAVQAVAEWLADDADSWGRADPKHQMGRARSILQAVDQALAGSR